MTKKDKAKKNFFGLDVSEKDRIIRKAVNKAMKEQVDLVDEYGEIKIPKKASQQ